MHLAAICGKWVMAKYSYSLTHFFHNLAHFNGNFSRNTSIYFVKINVGNLEYCANIAFASIIQDISPPEATFFNIPKSVPLFAANKLNFIFTNFVIRF
jgi:hypothetical protein